MAAIITEQFRLNSADILESDITSNSYYVGIGQQDAWDDVTGTSASSPYPVGTFKDQQRVLDHITGLFKVNSNNLSRVIPRNDLAISSKCKAYDPLDPTCFYADTTNDIKPCYVMVDDQIFLCLQTPADGSAIDSTVIDALGGTFVDYGIVTTTSGYTFTYLGRFDQYSDINSSSFVDIGDGSATTSSLDATNAAFAYVQFTDGTLKLEAQTAGVSGNDISVTFELDDTSPFISGINITQDGNDVTITVPTNSDSPAGTVDLTIDQLAQAIRDAIEDSPASTLITASTLSGGSTLADIENLTNSPATFTLGGSNNLTTYIKQKTGGLLYGFNLINGGNVYQPAASEFTEGDTTVTFQADVTLQGTDEFGFSRSLTLTDADYVINIADKKISEIRLTSTHLDESFTSGDLLAWKNCRVDISDIETLRGTEILAFADGDATYAAEALRHDAVAMPKIGPIEGFGFEKYKTLPAFYVGLFVDTGNATYIPSDTDYHQVSLIKNPQSTSGGNLAGSYFQPLQYFTFPGTQEIPEDTATGDIGAGWQIIQDGKKVGVISHVQTVESGVALDPYRYYYYNDHYYGYESIQVSSVTDEASAITFEPPKDDTLGAATVTTSLIPDNNYEGSYEQGTGEVVFIDNRATITREEGQNEELKLIIQL
jgi:hypothetical protein